MRCFIECIYSCLFLQIKYFTDPIFWIYVDKKNIFVTLLKLFKVTSHSISCMHMKKFLSTTHVFMYNAQWKHLYKEHRLIWILELEHLLDNTLSKERNDKFYQKIVKKDKFHQEQEKSGTFCHILCFSLSFKVFFIAKYSALEICRTWTL